jgi:hypothetical protein
MLFGARHWFMDCATYPDRNVSVSFGMKAPTGRSDARDLFPNAQGLDIRERVVDQSIQLGDGGWGFYLSSEGFAQVGSWTLFGSGIYLFNPRTRNNTISPPSMLAPGGPDTVAPSLRYNTVNDSYLVRGGAGHSIPGLTGTGVSLAARIEGVPVHDVFGETDGFRRPGYYLTLEPGLNYATGRTTWFLSVPFRVHQNVKPDANGVAKDSTFADHMVLVGVTYRFNGNYEAAAPVQ